MAEMKWIPVCNGYPEENQEVWVTLEYHGGDRRIQECVYHHNSFMENKYISCDDIVIAWMSRFVPEPYKADRDGG